MLCYGRLVNINGGHSIGVYNSETKDKSKVFRMLDENRIKYFVPADYTKGAKLEKEELIDKLSDSTSFANTHAVIEQLTGVKGWSGAQKNKLLRIALENTQVTYILKDYDLKAFYTIICDGVDSEDADGVREILNS